MLTHREWAETYEQDMREVLEQLSRYLKSVDEEVKVISKQIQSLECVSVLSLKLHISVLTGSI